SIEAKSPRQTAHTQLHKTRNKSQLSATPETSALSRSDLVLEPKVALFGRLFKLPEWRVENEKRSKGPWKSYWIL
ncbi:MAG: hypothetical protein ACI9U6_002995, partial [Loktanella salsilacus]|uniref:hypothetical protein n=1 Tax=Loktanella salsilacus TaxID=195913 RepID=UPI003989AA5F